MKKIGLFLLAVMMVAGLAGCKKDHDADPVGTWVMVYDWRCDGSTATVVWHIHSNGTYISSEGATGNWSVSKSSITLNYAGGTIYGGEVDGDKMSGTMNDTKGVSGCWSAARTSTTP